MADDLTLYEHDFVRWSEEQAGALRAAAASGTNLPLDWDNLAEEIDGLECSLRSELRNRLATVIEHLFKLELSGAIEPRDGWTETILRERTEIETLFEDDPSLRSALPEASTSAARKARRLAEASLRRHGEREPGTASALAETRFSEAEVLGPWLPDGSP